MSTTTKLSERQMYAQSFEREYQTTLRVLRAYPADQAQLKWAERSNTAMQTAWTLVLSQGVVLPILSEPTLAPPEKMPEPPATWGELIGAIEHTHAQVTTALQAATDAQLDSAIQMTMPGGLVPMRRLDVLWMMLMDTIHHRGQLSVYLRASGAKVPSIYGPSGDEPWK